MDILLDKEGDLYVDSHGDIQLTGAIKQKIRIRLLWFLGEWRWNREMGLPYLEQLLTKNPDTMLFEELIREEIFNVPEITEVKEVRISIDNVRRQCVIAFHASTDMEIINEEVIISV